MKSEAGVNNWQRYKRSLVNAQDSQTKQKEKNNNLEIEQEIECPCCRDIMTLYSKFDRIGYLCECNFPLYLN